MKTKTAKQPKQAKATVHLKDLKPKKDPKGAFKPLFAVTVDRLDGRTSS